MSTNPWDERFRGDRHVYGEGPSELLESQLARLPAGGKVLCLAEGEGRNATFLAARGFEVTAVDGSEVGMQKARRLAAKRGVFIETVVEDLRDFEPAARAWDAVVGIWCHLPSGLRPTIHHRIGRALRRGGVVVLEHDHPLQLRDGSGRIADREVTMELDEVRRSFSKLETLHAFEGVRDVHEGLAHTGSRFVTQFVARKVSW